MSPADILTMPTHALPQALYEHGLAPAVVERLPDSWHAQPSPVYVFKGEAWEPHVDWRHAAPLMERFRISVEYRLWPDGSGNWSVRVRDVYNTFVARFEDIPDIICRVALLVHVTIRTGEVVPHDA
jgi:hypothetical protein